MPSGPNFEKKNWFAKVEIRMRSKHVAEINEKKKTTNLEEVANLW